MYFDAPGRENMKEWDFETRDLCYYTRKLQSETYHRNG